MIRVAASAWWNRGQRGSQCSRGCDVRRKKDTPGGTGRRGAGCCRNRQCRRHVSDTGRHRPAHPHGTDVRGAGRQRQFPHRHLGGRCRRPTTITDFAIPARYIISRRTLVWTDGNLRTVRGAERYLWRPVLSASSQARALANAPHPPKGVARGSLSLPRRLSLATRLTGGLPVRAE
jgi:hypothetical protein